MEVLFFKSENRINAEKKCSTTYTKVKIYRTNFFNLNHCRPGTVGRKEKNKALMNARKTFKNKNNTLTEH